MKFHLWCYMFYVYLYKDDFGKVFYVGKGKGQRCFNHMNWKQTSKRMKDKLVSLERKGVSPTIEIVFQTASEDKAYEHEEALIVHYGRKGFEPEGSLMNICLNSRPPRYKSSELIESIYNNTASDSKSCSLKEIDAFLKSCESRKRFQVLLLSELGERLIHTTKHLPVCFSVPQRIFHLRHSLLEAPGCCHCGGAVSFKCYRGESKVKEEWQYADFCSVKCRNQSDWGRQVSAAVMNPDIKRKLKCIMDEKVDAGEWTTGFHTANPMKTKEGVEKWKKARRS